MAHKVIMVFDWNFICEFGNLTRNFPNPIELSIRNTKYNNTPTPTMYYCLPPNPPKFYLIKISNVVHHDLINAWFNGAMWKLMIYLFFCI